MPSETLESQHSAPNPAIPIQYWVLVGGVLLAAGLLVTIPAFVDDTDASLRRKVVGRWQVCPKDKGCSEFIFDADGELAMVYSIIDLRWRWSIHNGIMDLQFKEGGNAPSALAAGLMPFWSSNWREHDRLSVRFEGDSVMYLNNQGPFVRLGAASK